MELAEYFVSPGEEKTCKDQVKLCCCKFSVEGTVTFTIENNFMDEEVSLNQVYQPNSPSTNYVGQAQNGNVIEMEQYFESGMKRYKDYNQNHPHNQEQGIQYPNKGWIR